MQPAVQRRRRNADRGRFARPAPDVVSLVEVDEPANSGGSLSDVAAACGCVRADRLCCHRRDAQRGR